MQHMESKPPAAHRGRQEFVDVRGSARHQRSVQIIMVQKGDMSVLDSEVSHITYAGGGHIPELGHLRHA